MAQCLVAALVASLFACYALHASFQLTYEEFAADLDFYWGHLLDGPEALAAPVWVGEFNADKAEHRWWRYMLRYLREQDVGWAFWAWNGEKTCGPEPEIEDWGLVVPNGTRPRSIEKAAQLLRLAGGLDPWG